MCGKLGKKGVWNYSWDEMLCKLAISGLEFATYLLISSLYWNCAPERPETALFALRRKRAACKAALRHRRITAPRSPFSGILKLRSGERRRRYLVVFLCGIYFVSSKPSCPLSFYSDQRPATCSGRSLHTRKGLHFFVLHDVSWSKKKKKREERLAFVVCLTVENEAWKAGAGGSASPLLLLWAGLDYRAWDPHWQHRQTKRDCERRQGKESFTELEKPGRVLEYIFPPNKWHFGSYLCAVCVIR